jgi:hypothetical protein
MQVPPVISPDKNYTHPDLGKMAAVVLYWLFVHWKQHIDMRIEFSAMSTGALY